MSWSLLTCDGKGEPQVHGPNVWGPDLLHCGDPGGAQTGLWFPSPQERRNGSVAISSTRGSRKLRGWVRGVGVCKIGFCMASAGRLSLQCVACSSNHTVDPHSSPGLLEGALGFGGAFFTPEARTGHRCDSLSLAPFPPSCMWLLLSL